MNRPFSTNSIKVPTKIIEIIDAFLIEHLEIKKEILKKISNLKCGFEKWLQIEFVLWASSKYRLNLFGNDDKDEIGVENYTEINTPAKRWKIIDIWMYVGKFSTHYLEFKSTVKGWNELRQITSWIDDYRCLINIKKKGYYPYGKASILFGSAKEKEVRKDINEWKNFVADKIKTPEVKPIYRINESHYRSSKRYGLLLARAGQERGWRKRMVIY